MAKRPAFDWDEANAGHIARHGVLPEEAEQVIANEPLPLNAGVRRGEFRRLCIGRTDSGRFLSVVYIVRRARIRVVTAYPSNAIQRRLYEASR